MVFENTGGDYTVTIRVGSLTEIVRKRVCISDIATDLPHRNADVRLLRRRPHPARRTGGNVAIEASKSTLGFEETI